MYAGHEYDPFEAHQSRHQRPLNWVVVGDWVRSRVGGTGKGFYWKVYLVDPLLSWYNVRHLGVCVECM